MTVEAKAGGGWVFEPGPRPGVPVEGRAERFPVHRIYCVGQNYAEHAREMGSSGREPPVFFDKPADAVTTAQQIPYPPRTQNLHHEAELVVALGGGGRDLEPEQARELIFGYAAGVDLTRRDLQAAAKKRGGPWTTAKGFDHSAPVSPIQPAEQAGNPQAAEISLAVNGLIDPARAWRKQGLKPGDALVLTKPIGTGTLFAADMRGKAKGRWVDGAIQSMLVSNQSAASCLHRHGATACTDVTGFGLLGHLVEMTRASDADVQLDLQAVPLLDGAEQTVAAGILSSLQPQNVRLRRAVRNADTLTTHARYPLLFDPQTAGGLLASVPVDAASACLDELHQLGYAHAAIIGRVEPRTTEAAPIQVSG